MNGMNIVANRLKIGLYDVRIEVVRQRWIGNEFHERIVTSEYDKFPHQFIDPMYATKYFIRRVTELDDQIIGRNGADVKHPANFVLFVDEGRATVPDIIGKVGHDGKEFLRPNSGAYWEYRNLNDTNLGGKERFVLHGCIYLSHIVVEMNGCVDAKGEVTEWSKDFGGDEDVAKQLFP